MRTKAEHLGELVQAYSEVQGVIERVEATRTNVPVESLLYKQLKRTATELRRLRFDLWFAYQHLDQHGYWPAKAEILRQAQDDNPNQCRLERR